MNTPPQTRGIGPAVNTEKRPLIVCLLFSCLAFAGPASGGEEDRFVGSQACMECHEYEYKNFQQYAKKAHSFEAIEKMRHGLTQEELTGCYGCHTTGYGKPGGFVSEEKTPEMKNAGCEVCHGPGGRHVESADPADILGSGRMDVSQCGQCHNSERVDAFDFKPMLHGGAH